MNLYLEDKFFRASFDIDITANQILISRISEKSGIKFDDIYKMTLQSYEGYLFEKCKENKTLYLIDSIKCDGLKFCPKCLKKDKTPYWRRSWRLSFHNVCIHHKVFMEDRCQQCKSKIKPLQMKNPDGVVFCQKCGFDLRLTNANELRRGYEITQEAVRHFMSILASGKTKLGRFEIYSIFYFKVFAKLQIIMKSKHILCLDGFELHKNARHILQYDKSSSKQKSPRVKSIPFTAIYYLLKNFPINFQKFIEKTKLTTYDLKRDMEQIPFWYESITSELSSKLSMRGKEVTLNEVESVKAYLLSHNKAVNKAELTRLIGCNMFHNSKLGYKYTKKR